MYIGKIGRYLGYRGGKGPSGGKDSNVCSGRIKIRGSVSFGLSALCLSLVCTSSRG